MQDFKLGDRVKFQLQSDGEYPRHNGGLDEDPTGEGPWAYGVVEKTYGDSVDIAWYHPEAGRLTWEWQQPRGYVADYYSRPGYLCLAEEDQATQVTPKNNDGRTTCAWCSAPTKSVQSILSVYNICTKCGR
jgi:hypothetical protein